MLKANSLLGQGNKKTVPYVILTPTDCQSLDVVLSNVIRVFNQEPPWDTDHAKEGTLKIIQWQKQLLADTIAGKETKLQIE